MPVVKDDRLMLRALENLHKSAVILVSTILKFEYLYKRVQLHKDPARNFETFASKCAGRYGLGLVDMNLLKEVIHLGRKHKESGMEFPKKEKIVILDDNLGSVEINLEKMKVFLGFGRKLLENTNRNFKELLEKGI